MAKFKTFDDILADVNKITGVTPSVSPSSKKLQYRSQPNYSDIFNPAIEKDYTEVFEPILKDIPENEVERVSAIKNLKAKYSEQLAAKKAAEAAKKAAEEEAARKLSTSEAWNKLNQRATNKQKIADEMFQNAEKQLAREARQSQIEDAFKIADKKASLKERFGPILDARKRAVEADNAINAVSSKLGDYETKSKSLVDDAIARIKAAGPRVDDVIPSSVPTNTISEVAEEAAQKIATPPVDKVDELVEGFGKVADDLGKNVKEVIPSKAMELFDKFLKTKAGKALGRTAGAIGAVSLPGEMEASIKDNDSAIKSVSGEDSLRNKIGKSSKALASSIRPAATTVGLAALVPSPLTPKLGAISLGGLAAAEVLDLVAKGLITEDDAKKALNVDKLPTGTIPEGKYSKPTGINLKDNVKYLPDNLSEIQGNVSPEVIKEYILKKAQETGRDPALMLAMFDQESTFNPRAVSETGAKGLGQMFAGAFTDVKNLKPEAYKGMAYKDLIKPENWQKQVDAGFDYLEQREIYAKNKGLDPNDPHRILQEYYRGFSPDEKQRSDGITHADSVLEKKKKYEKLLASRDPASMAMIDSGNAGSGPTEAYLKFKEKYPDMKDITPEEFNKRRAEAIAQFNALQGSTASEMGENAILNTGPLSREKYGNLYSEMLDSEAKLKDLNKQNKEFKEKEEIGTPLLEEQLQKEEEIQKQKEAEDEKARQDQAAALLRTPASEGYTEATREALLAEQERANTMRNMVMFMEGANVFGRGLSGAISGLAPPEDTTKRFRDQYMELAGQGVKDLEARIKNEADDPNSRKSKEYVQFAKEFLTKAGLPVDIVDNMSANDLEKRLNQVIQMTSQLETARQRSADNKLKAQQLALDKQVATQDRQDKIMNTLENQVNNRFDKNTKDEIARIQAADRVNALIKQIKSGVLVDSANIRNTLTNDVSILALPVGTRGGVSDREKAAINTLSTFFKDILAYMGNEPVKTIPKKYMKQLDVEVNALRSKYVEALKQKTNSLINGTNNKTAKELFKGRLNEYVTPSMVENSNEKLQDPVFDKKIENFMIKNNIKDKNEAITILKAKGIL